MLRTSSLLTGASALAFVVALTIGAPAALADTTPDCNTGPGADSTECGVGAEANGASSIAVGSDGDDADADGPSADGVDAIAIGF